MGANIGAMRKHQEVAASKRGGADYWNVPVGENLLYVCPPLPGSELPFVETAVHYSAGPENKMVVCLDEERNPILKDDRIKAILAKRKKDVSDGCQACIRIDDGAQVADEAAGRWWWAIIPLKFRKNTTKKWREADDADELRILACGFTIWTGITDIFINNGDISDPNKAVLVRLIREGTGMKTKYTVSADTDSVRDGGVQLSKPLRALVKKAVQEDEAGDLYRVVGNTIRSSAEVHAIIEGVPMETTDDADDDTDDGKKPDCFGLDYEADDDDCKGCAMEDECAKECSPPGAAVADDDSGEVVTGDDSDVETTGEEMEAQECVVGNWYADDADDITPMKFTGSHKKGKKTWCFFVDEDGDKMRLMGNASVFSIPEPTGASDGGDVGETSDTDMEALDKAIAARKAKGKKAPSKPGKAPAKGKGKNK